MRFSSKDIVVIAIPIIIVLLGIGTFLYFYLPQKKAYADMQHQYEQSMKQLDEYHKNAGSVTVRKIVTNLEREYSKLNEEYEAIKKHLIEAYPFTFSEKYPSLSGLDFKNLVVKKRRELGRQRIGFEQFDTTIPKSAEVPDLVRRLEISETIIRVFQEAGTPELKNIHITQGKMKTNKMTQEPTYEEFTATFNFETDYGELINLLYALEHQRLFFIINYCHISRVTEETVKADLVVKAFRFLLG
ncbi:hypothetical protein IID04_01765 [PVC group bacterium]|nr:hypothetical protein [PVC group bacterium]